MILFTGLIVSQFLRCCNSFLSLKSKILFFVTLLFKMREKEKNTARKRGDFVYKIVISLEKVVIIRNNRCILWTIGTM
jgi:hypothetical protein